MRRKSPTARYPRKSPSEHCNWAGCIVLFRAPKETLLKYTRFPDSEQTPKSTHVVFFSVFVMAFPGSALPTLHGSRTGGRCWSLCLFAPRGQGGWVVLPPHGGIFPASAGGSSVDPTRAHYTQFARMLLEQQNTLECADMFAVFFGSKNCIISNQNCK